MDFVRAPIQAPSPPPVLRPHRRLLLLFYLARPLNLALLAATALLALYLLHQTQPLLPIHEVRAFYLITSALLIMAGGYWLNDLYDVEIDTINRPRRAAAVRLLTRRRLLTAVTIAWGAALLCTIPLRWQFKALHLLVIGALFWYNRWGKRLGLPGNLLVAGLTALLPWELMLLTGRTAYAVDWMIPLAAVFNFAREVVKDAEDQPGDLPHGVRSLPMRLSPRAWHLILRVGWLSLLAFLYLPALTKYLLWQTIPAAYLIAVTLGSALPLLWGLTDLSNYRLLSRLLKVAMAGGLLALVFL